MAVEVIIRLKSARGPQYDRPLGHIVISNDGTGTVKLGNYKYVLAHAGKHWEKNKKGKPFKKGRIRNFPRNMSPYRLVQRCLKHAGEV